MKRIALVGGPLDGEHVDVDPEHALPVLGIAVLADALPSLPDYLSTIPGFPVADLELPSILGLAPMAVLAMYALVSVSRVIYGSLTTATVLPSRYVFTGVRSLERRTEVHDLATLTALDSAPAVAAPAVP